MNYCDNCEHRKKLKGTTYTQCVKFNVVLSGNPPVKCDKCKDDVKTSNKTKSKEVTSRKKETIDVR